MTPTTCQTKLFIYFVTGNVILFAGVILKRVTSVLPFDPLRFPNVCVVKGVYGFGEWAEIASVNESGFFK